jgi:hypothetical protein
MKKEWLAVITRDMYGNTKQFIEEVDVENEADKLLFVKTHFSDKINYTFRPTKGGAQEAMRDMLNDPATISLMR